MRTPHANQNNPVRPGRRSRSLSFDVLEGRLLLSADFRTIDGTGNNVANPGWGAADTNLIRLAAAAYPPNGSGDAIVHESLPDPLARANPRDISNAIAVQVGDILNQRRVSDWVWQWGQFVDHDIDLTGNSSANGTADIPLNDPSDPLGPNPIPFSRSDFDPLTGTSPDNPRQQLNQITAFIDASNVYGSDQVRAAALRTFVGGQLKTSSHNLLPFNTPGLDNAGGPSPSLFLAGDVRANEQIALTATHTLFVREHNRLAGQLSKQNPSLTDEELYQKARQIVGAEMQIITYNEFLPALLGPYAPNPASLNYEPTVNAAIANEFSTALYRFGHSMLSPQLLLMAKSGKPVDTLPLRNAFFNPNFLAGDPKNLDRLLHGLAVQQAQEVDNKVVDDVRNFLFGPPGAGGLDLASLNIQRGRDHGLPDYNTVRAAYGLAPVSSFSQISSDPAVQAALEALYGRVNNIDPWVGGLAEDHLPGASTGELVTAGIVDQFTRLAVGDRFFYINDAAPWGDPDITAIIDLDSITLAQIIHKNTGVKKIHENVFFVESGTSSLSIASDAGSDVGPESSDPAAASSPALADPASLSTSEAQPQVDSNDTQSLDVSPQGTNEPIAQSTTTSGQPISSPDLIDATLRTLLSAGDQEVDSTETDLLLELEGNLFEH